MRLSLLLQAAATALASASLTPPVLPLIVRNPYLSTWLPAAREEPWTRWPTFWTGSTFGFAVMASVPDSGLVYPLLGRPQDFIQHDHHAYSVFYPEYLGSTFDASVTNLTYLIPPPRVGGEPLKLVLSFLSPITPTSTLRQSLPAAYMTCLVEGSFDLNVFVDLNGEWVSGNRDNHIRWELKEPDPSQTSKGPAIKTWKVSRANEQLLTEFADHAEWGTLHVSAPSDVTHQSGKSTKVRQHFAETGSLKNEVEGGQRGMFEDEPIFAFSKSFRLGSSSSTEKAKKTEDSVMFTFALIQNPVVQFASARGLTLMRPFWSSFFMTDDEMIRYHYNDFETASALARNYSDQLAKDAYASGSQDYQDIAALSARQVLGATQFSGTPDNPILFLKEISSNGNFQTVDVIFPAFPFFLYTNPRWLAYLLEPLLEHQMSGQYPNDYSMHDIGTHFPNATGHADGNDEYMPVEECGNMLIMGLALVNAFRYDTQPAFLPAGSVQAEKLDMPGSDVVGADGMDKPWPAAPTTTGPEEAARWVGRSYKLWKQWTGYLVRESLVPHNQLSTDDFAGWLALQTNLALKGIIGIRAMSEIAETLGEAEDAEYYRNISDVYIRKWQEYGLSRDGTHAKLAYDWYGSWTTLYNLFADALLCFHLPPEKPPTTRWSAKWPWGQRPLDGPDGGGGDEEGSRAAEATIFIPDKIYKIQSDWYHYVRQKYGLPLDSRHLYTKSDWEFFAAAVTSKSTRAEILQSVAKWINETATDRPLTDLYETEGDGGFPGVFFMARPVVGGHFSFLALERACGGQAVAALEFLEKEPVAEIGVAASLLHDMDVRSVGYYDDDDDDDDDIDEVDEL